MMRDRAILAVLITLALGAFFIDVYAIPGAILPSAAYAIPILIAAYLLSPRMVAAIGGYTFVLRLLAMVIHQTPPWLAALYLLSIVIIAFLSTGLTAKARSEAALAEQRLKLLEEIQSSEAEVIAQRNELREREAALRESEERLRGLLDNTTAVVYLRDSQGRYSLVNRQYEKLFDVTEEQAIGKTVHDILPRETADALGANDRKVVEAGAPLEFEEVIPKEDGLHTYLSIKFPLCDTRGKVYSVGGISTDITDRKRIEEDRERLLKEVQLRAAELNAMIASMADGVAIYGETEQMIFMNPAAEAMLGYTQEERMRSLPERVALQRIETPEGNPFPIEEIPGRRALRGETVHGVVMVLHPPRSNKTVWAANSAAPIRTADGRLLGAVSIFTDVTMLHELLEQREDLLHTASHDLRNPLTIIIGQSQLLLRMLEKAGLTGLEHKSAETIFASARRMNAMIQDLVDTTRLEAGELRIEKRAIDLSPFVDELLDRSKGAIDFRRIRVDIPSGLPLVSADPDRLERIFINLLTNALKYSALDTEVSVIAEKADTKVKISVSDCGVGIAPEELPHIFERYFRAKRIKETEGVGLGLYITKMLVNAHGGEIGVRSELTKGSTFYFTLLPAGSEC